MLLCSRPMGICCCLGKKQEPRLDPCSAVFLCRVPVQVSDCLVFSPARYLVAGERQKARFSFCCSIVCCLRDLRCSPFCRFITLAALRIQLWLFASAWKPTLEHLWLGPCRLLASCVPGCFLDFPAYLGTPLPLTFGRASVHAAS